MSLITDWGNPYFIVENNAENLMAFTERKLRALTLMGSDEEKIEVFRDMVNDRPGYFSKKVIMI